MQTQGGPVQLLVCLFRPKYYAVCSAAAGSTGDQYRHARRKGKCSPESRRLTLGPRLYWSAMVEVQSLSGDR